MRRTTLSRRGLWGEDRFSVRDEYHAQWAENFGVHHELAPSRYSRDRDTHRRC